MKKKYVAFLIISLLTTPIFADQEKNLLEAFEFNLDVISALQGNLVIQPMVTSAPSRIRFTGKIPFDSRFSFIVRASGASGDTQRSYTGEFLPVNDIATYKSRFNEGGRVNIVFDVARFHWMVFDDLEITAGLTDVTSIDSKNTGFANNNVSLDEGEGFINAHFTRNAGLAFLEQYDFPSVPALAAVYRLGDYDVLRFIVTFGEVEEHILFRNTWGIEWQTSLIPYGTYRLILGFTDTHYSYTHHVAPCAGINFDQMLFKGFYLFGSYSITENHLVSRFFTNVFYHANTGFGVVLDGNTPADANTYLGVGASGVWMLDSGVPESVAEAFLRIRITDSLTFSPDIQCIFNPAGFTEVDRTFLLVWALRVHAWF